MAISTRWPLLAISMVLVGTGAWFFMGSGTTDESLSGSTIAQSGLLPDGPAVRPGVLPPPTQVDGSGDERDLVSRRDTAISSPFAPTTPAEVTDPSSQIALLSDLLKDYRSGLLDPDDKIAMHTALQVLNQSESGREWIIETFFSIEDSEQAEALYDLILDADLKDPALITAILQREQGEPELQARIRLVDLISDLNSREGLPFVPEIDAFLGRMAIDPDPALREPARVRRVWYLVEHEQPAEATLSEYLLDPSREVRREIYEIIEGRPLDESLPLRESLTPTLNALLHANDLGVDAEERERIKDLLGRQDPQR